MSLETTNTCLKAWLGEQINSDGIVNVFKRYAKSGAAPVHGRHYAANFMCGVCEKNGKIPGSTMTTKRRDNQQQADELYKNLSEQDIDVRGGNLCYANSED